MLGKICNPSIQQKGNEKSNSKQRACSIRVNEGKALTEENNKEEACLASSD
jgi:hypothetical protein